MTQFLINWTTSLSHLSKFCKFHLLNQVLRFLVWELFLKHLWMFSCFELVTHSWILRKDGLKILGLVESYFIFLFIVFFLWYQSNVALRKFQFLLAKYHALVLQSLLLKECAEGHKRKKTFLFLLTYQIKFRLSSFKLQDHTLLSQIHLI